MKDAKGHGSDAHNAGIEKLPTPTMTKEEFARLVADAKTQSAQTDKITEKVIADRAAKFVHPSGRALLVSPSLDPGGGLRATSFDEHGEPVGHREYPSHDSLGLRSEISMALGGGFKLTGGK
jgi:hypothetical protein